MSRAWLAILSHHAFAAKYMCWRMSVCVWDANCKKAKPKGLKNCERISNIYVYNTAPYVACIECTCNTDAPTPAQSRDYA